MKHLIKNSLSIYKSKLKNLFFEVDYSYIYFDNYLIGEKRLVPGNIKFDKLTNLCEIMKESGSDKGGFAGMSRHNYTPLYHVIFKRFKDQNINFFELGIGTTNIDISANMGNSGVPGASLRGWKKYFSKANIFSADIDKSILIQEDRIKTYYCDQTNPKLIQILWNEIDSQSIDIILDDGLHEFHANICFFENSIHKLSDGGIYIIEDVLRDQFENWVSYLNEYCTKNKKLRFTILQIPNPYNQHDNNIITIIKKS